MAKEKKQELVKAESNLPDYLRGDLDFGKEGIDQEDLGTPRLKLLQDMSPEVKQEGQKVGTIINTLTGRNYGNSLLFIPIKTYKSRIYWKDRKDGGGIACSADNAITPRQRVVAELGDKEIETGPTCRECPFKDWHNDLKDKAPKCTLYYNFIVLVEGDDAPVVLSMERTKIKTAKKLISLIAYSGKIAIFGKKYKLSVDEISNKMGTYQIYDVAPVGLVTEDEYKSAKDCYTSFKDREIDTESVQPE